MAVYNLNARHALLYSTIGYLSNEQKSLENARFLLLTSFLYILIGTAIEIVFFTLYNGRYHPFGKIIMSDDDDDSMDLEQVKSSFWSDKFDFLRKWNNIKNADRPKKFCDQTQDTNTFPKYTAVNGELELKVISEFQSLNKKNSDNADNLKDESRLIAQNIVSNLIESLDLGDELPQVTTEQQQPAVNQKNDPEAVELIKDYECIKDKQMKEWHFLTLMVIIILLFGLFTGMAVVFGLGLNVQIGKSIFYSKLKNHSQ